VQQGLKNLLPAPLPVHRGAQHAQRPPVVPVIKEHSVITRSTHYLDEETMISYDLDRNTGVLTVRPEGKLEVQDFQTLSKTVDPFIEHFPAPELESAQNWITQD